jgi:hypothetical protein
LDTDEITVQILTDSRIALELLKNRKNHTHLIEQIRKSYEIGEPQMDNRIQLDQSTRMAPKERAGYQLAKVTATSNDINECYSKIPKSTVKVN